MNLTEIATALNEMSVYIDNLETYIKKLKSFEFVDDNVNEQIIGIYNCFGAIKNSNIYIQDKIRE